MSQFRPAKRRVEVSVGESVRIVRELQELSQNQLAELTGIPQTTISAIENDRVRLGVERGEGSGPCPQVSPGSTRISRLGLTAAISCLATRERPLPARHHVSALTAKTRCRSASRPARAERLSGWFVHPSDPCGSWRSARWRFRAPLPRRCRRASARCA
jgi:hypothetical protein